jgi:putative membrane-bound dehydrogenase-like protein
MEPHSPCSATIFRNPYELALDSFGNVWQTDNDDDGNAWVARQLRDAGRQFRLLGSGRTQVAGGQGVTFPCRESGVVPNIQRTGAGSPTGLVVYEGKLLPEKYRGQLLHSEAGKRLINTYFLSPDGAGYSLKIEDTVSAADTWFRPSDVAVGPDGAVYIADWYDASVGGHQMKDIDRGRIYRLAPVGYKPTP